MCNVRLSRRITTALTQVESHLQWRASPSNNKILSAEYGSITIERHLATYLQPPMTLFRDRGGRLMRNEQVLSILEHPPEKKGKAL